MPLPTMTNVSCLSGVTVELIAFPPGGRRPGAGETKKRRLGRGSAPGAFAWFQKCRGGDWPGVVAWFTRSRAYWRAVGADRLGRAAVLAAVARDLAGCVPAAPGHRCNPRPAGPCGLVRGCESPPAARCG